MEILNAAILDIHAPELILGSQGLASGSECSSEASWADYDHMGDRELFPSLLDDTSLISSIHGDDTSVELGDVDEDPLLNNCFLSSNLDTTPPLDTHSEPEIPLGMFDLTCADLADFNDLDLGDSTVSSMTPYANDLLMSKTSPSHTCYETSSIPHSLSSPAHNYLTSSPNCMMTSPSRTMSSPNRAAMSSPNRSYSTTTSPRHNHSSNPGLSQHVTSSPPYSRHVLSSPVRNEHIMSSSLQCHRMISSPSRARSNPDVSCCGISSPTRRSNHTTNTSAHAWLNRSPSPTHSIRSTVTTSSLYNESSSISNAQSRCTSPTSDSDKAPTSARNRGKRKQRTTSSRNASVSIEQWEAHRKTNKRSRQTSNGDRQYRACAKHKSISSSDNNLSNTERRKLVADLSHVITEEMDIRQQIDIINIIQPDKHTHNFVIDLNLLTDEKLTRIKHIIDTCRQQNKARHTTPPAAAPAQHKRGRGKGRGHAAQEGRGHAASVKRTSSNPASSSCGLSNRVPVGGGHHPLQPHGRRSHTITPSSSVSSLATCTSGYASDDTGTAQQVQQHHAENNTPHDSQQQSKITTAIQQQPKLTKRERQAKAKQERQQMQKHARQQRKEEQSGLFVNEEIVILTSKRHPSSSATTSVSQVTDDNHLLSYVIDSGSDIEVDI